MHDFAAVMDTAMCGSFPTTWFYHLRLHLLRIAYIPYIKETYVGVLKSQDSEQCDGQPSVNKFSPVKVISQFLLQKT